MPFQIESQSTLTTLVNKIARSVGYSAAIADPAGTTDPAVAQMVDAVNEAAEELVTMPWQELARNGSITIQAVVPGESERGFDLPEDLYAFIVNTQNNQTLMRPGFGPLSPQVWQAVRTVSPYVAFDTMFRVKDNQLYVLNPPTDAQTFTFEYQSWGYVIDGDDSTLFKNSASKNSDIFVFDPQLVYLLGLAKWKEKKGFDSSVAVADYTRALADRKERLEAAPTISMVATAANNMPPFVPLTTANLPQTGYGS